MLVQAKFWNNFFSGNFVEWFIFNSKKEMGKLNNSSWKLTFDEAIRRIWLRRNAWIFKQEVCDSANLYWKIILAVKDFEDSTEVLNFSNATGREITVGWNPPAEGWVKCNVDGSSRSNSISTSCGGLIRDEKGQWMVGFSLNMGSADSLSSKLKGISAGLELTWRKRFQRVTMETDSREAVKLVKDGCGVEHPMAGPTEEIRSWMNRN